MRARIRAAATGTTVPVMMRNLLIEFLQPPDAGPDESEYRKRAWMLDEVLERVRSIEVGVDTDNILNREVR